MYAEWVGKDVWVGPKHLGRWAIYTGDIRKVHAKKDGKYILEGENGKGYFGWVDACNVKILGEGNPHDSTSY